MASFLLPCQMLGDNSWLRYPLILPGLVAVLGAYAVFARFIRTSPASTRREVLLGLTIMLIGTLGIETVGGWFDPVLHGPSLTYVLLVTLEEGLEMAGSIVILVGLMRYVEHHLGTLTIPGRCARPMAPAV